jgi:NodT family efflux transporter outer membrane factor (OMF) lipoprotein
MAGCTAGPDFRSPPAPSPARYTAAQLDSADPAQRLTRGKDIPGDWWTLFHSDALNQLVREALANSPDVEAAKAALRAARENVLAQQGAFSPSIDAQLSSTRQSVASRLASPLSSGDDIFTLHTAQLSVGYVPDVFGAARRQLESLQAQADSQRFLLEAAQVSLTTNLVTTVVQRAALRAQIKTTRDIIALSTRLLELYKRGRSLGQIGGVDLALQEIQLAQVMVTLPPLERQLVAVDDQLAILVGRLPSDPPVPDIELEALRLPEELPLSLPSKLVEQRPDVRAAEEALHAASAQIGVATANRLPNLTLTAGAGSVALQVSRLFSGGSSFWSVGSTLTQTVFDGGILLHRQRSAEAAYDEAAAQYRSTVLAAFRNVADTLGAIQVDAKAFGGLTVAEQAAQKSLAIAREQQAAGLTGSLPTVSAEQAYRQAALGRIQAQADRLIDSAALFQALGGGWWNVGDR